MNILIMVFIAIGFGAIAAYLVTEIRAEDLHKQMNDTMAGLLAMKKQVKSEKELIEGITCKIQQMEYQQKRDRGAIWESINNLWHEVDGKEGELNDDDGRNQDDQR